jgi:hypothetical protein
MGKAVKRDPFEQLERADNKIIKKLADAKGNYIKQF